MARTCPVCGKGMFRHKKLLRHLKTAHPAYFKKFYDNYGSQSRQEFTQR